MMMTAKQARENVAKYNKMQEEERVKRARAYVKDVCEMVDRESNNGNCAVIVKEMEYLADHNIAEKILKDELGYEVDTIPGRAYIRISW